MGKKIEAPKELAEKIYKLIENVKVDGKLRKGANEVTKSIEKSEAKIVIIASDVQPEEITIHLPVISKEKHIPYVHVPSKAELGASAGLPVGTSAIAIVHPGDAKKHLSETLKSIDIFMKKPAEKKAEAKSKEKPTVKTTSSKKLVPKSKALGEEESKHAEEKEAKPKEEKKE